MKFWRYDQPQQAMRRRTALHGALSSMALALFRHGTEAKCSPESCDKLGEDAVGSQPNGMKTCSQPSEFECHLSRAFFVEHVGKPTLPVCARQRVPHLPPPQEEGRVKMFQTVAPAAAPLGWRQGLLHPLLRKLRSKLAGDHFPQHT